MLKKINTIGMTCLVYFVILTVNAGIYMVIPLLASALYMLAFTGTLMWGFFRLAYWLAKKDENK